MALRIESRLEKMFFNRDLWQVISSVIGRGEKMFGNCGRFRFGIVHLQKKKKLPTLYRSLLLYFYKKASIYIKTHIYTSYMGGPPNLQIKGH